MKNTIAILVQTADLKKTVRKQQADQRPQRDDHVPAESRLLQSSVHL